MMSRLLRAVFETRMAALTKAIATGPPPLGPATPARERIAAVHDAIVEAKLENRQITLALEQIERRPSRSSFFDAPNYKTAHALFCELLVDIVGANRIGPGRYDGGSWAPTARPGPPTCCCPLHAST